MQRSFFFFFGCFGVHIIRIITAQTTTTTTTATTTATIPVEDMFVQDACGQWDQFPGALPKICLQHDGMDRCWYTYVPSSLVPATANTVPLVVDLHGITGCADYQQYFTGWKEKAENDGFIVAYPQGTVNLTGTEGYDSATSWNAGSCCGGAMLKNIDDVGFILKLVGNMKAAHNIDATRIYMAGHSNGCAMAQRIAVEASNIVAAVGCHSLYLMASPSYDYVAVPMIEVHGTDDDIVNYTNWKNFYDRGFYGAISNLENWKTINNCQEGPIKAEFTKYYTTTYTQCDHGTEVSLVTLPGVAHHPYSEPWWDLNETSVDTTQLCWDFMKRFSKSSDNNTNPLDNMTDAPEEDMTDAPEEDMTDSPEDDMTDAPEDNMTEAASTYKVTGSMRLEYETTLTNAEIDTEETNIETVLKHLFGTLTVPTADIKSVGRRRLLGVVYDASFHVSGVSEAAAQTVTTNDLQTGVFDGSSQNVTVTVDPFVTEAETEPPSASPTVIDNVDDTSSVKSAHLLTLTTGCVALVILGYIM